MHKTPAEWSKAQATDRIEALEAEVAAERARSEARLESARQFVKRHPALSLIDLAEFEAFLMVPDAMVGGARPALTRPYERRYP